MGEGLRVAIALVSSALGGTAAAITRYLASGADPIEMAILRWGIGFLCLLPSALLLKVKWPERRDWAAVAALGVCFFGLFFILYNLAMSYTTAARASLALATLPLHTMVVAALLRAERLTARTLILPLYHSMSEPEQESVAIALRECLARPPAGVRGARGSAEAGPVCRPPGVLSGTSTRPRRERRTSSRAAGPSPLTRPGRHGPS